MIVTTTRFIAPFPSKIPARKASYATQHLEEIPEDSEEDFLYATVKQILRYPDMNIKHKLRQEILKCILIKN